MRTAELQRLPPPDPDTVARWTHAERRLLSCALGEAVFDDAARAAHLEQIVVAGVTPSSFYAPAHAAIFAALLGLRDRGEIVGVSALPPELPREQVAAMGGFLALAQLADAAPTSAHLAADIGAVRDAAARRKIETTARAALEALADPARDLAEIAAGMAATAEGGAISWGSRLPLWSPSQFINYITPAGWALLGDGYLERGELTSLVGVGGLGKTRLALRLALALILGTEWCGLPTHGAPVRVVMLSTENGLRRWKTDLGKMLAPLTLAERELVNDHLRILALLPGEETDLNLGDSSAVARLVSTLREHKPGLVILDPLADLIDGDENKTADLVGTLRTLAHVQTKGAPDAAFLLVHHARTGANNVAQAGDQFSAGNFGRGSKALYSRVRCEIQLAPGDREDATRLVLACGKSNNAAPFKTRGLVFNEDVFDYELDEGFDLDAWRSDVNGKRTGSKSVTVADVVEIVRELAPMPGSEVTAGDVQRTVKDRLGASEKTIRARLGESCKSGYLRTVRKGFYRLGSKPLPR
ncbi:MAG: AAA family ATPase [Burkholderiales bacterium]|nr:AAA family ATPase [Opitutaceae bacterium]